MSSRMVPLRQLTKGCYPLVVRRHTTRIKHHASSKETSVVIILKHFSLVPKDFNKMIKHWFLKTVKKNSRQKKSICSEKFRSQRWTHSCDVTATIFHHTLLRNGDKKLRPLNKFTWLHSDFPQLNVNPLTTRMKSKLVSRKMGTH